MANIEVFELIQGRGCDRLFINGERPDSEQNGTGWMSGDSEDDGDLDSNMVLFSENDGSPLQVGGLRIAGVVLPEHIELGYIGCLEPGELIVAHVVPPGEPAPAPELVKLRVTDVACGDPDTGNATVTLLN